MNEGHEPTFHGIGAGSIVDITLASEQLVCSLTAWKVLDDENYSDHHYVSYTIGSDTQAPNSLPISGWNTKKIDRKTLKLGLQLHKWVSGRNYAAGGSTASGFAELVTYACNFALPRKKNPRGKSAVYWWNTEIQDLRARSNRARRALKNATARAARRNKTDTPAEHNLVELCTALKESRKALKSAILKAKDRCWKEMLATIESDPWGKPYKMVMGKYADQSLQRKWNCTHLRTSLAAFSQPTRHSLSHSQASHMLLMYHRSPTKR